jgi:amino acid adenylation domain-containing protein
VSRLDNFFERGGHSLLATQLLARLRQRFVGEIPLKLLFAYPTIAEQAEQLTLLSLQHPAEEELDRAIVPGTRAEGDQVPLSFAQQRLWFLEQWESLTGTYNIAGALRLRGVIDLSILHHCLTLVIQRHETLRTSFQEVDGEPMQHLQEHVQMPPLLVEDLSHLEARDQAHEVLERAQQEAITPFDLSTPPLLRLRVLRLHDQEHLILLTFHHIIADGWSLGVLTREIATLYQQLFDGHPPYLPPLPIQYADFAIWQRTWLRDERLARQQDYWLQQLQGAPTLLDLPTDFPRPAQQRFAGASLPLILSAELTSRLKALAQHEHMTLFMLLLTGLQMVLARYSGQDDILVGTPIANRTHQEIEALIGFFVNTLVIRTTLADQPTGQQLLQRVRQTTLEAYAHQDLPFEQVVERLHPERSLSHAPLFQVLFAWQNAPLPTLTLPGVEVEVLEVETQRTKFDLVLDLAEVQGRIVGNWQYDTALFLPTTIERLSEHWQRGLEHLLTPGQTPVQQLSLLSPTEQQTLLRHEPVVDSSSSSSPEQGSLVSWLEEQAQQTPQAIAVRFEQEQLTYQQMHEQANQLAHLLGAQGVGSDAVVGVLLQRSLLLPVALLAVLKAGGVYLPLDPGYPPERLHYMLSNSGARLLLTDQPIEAGWREASLHVLDIHEQQDLLAQQPRTNLGRTIVGEHLAYLLYTSGSTGHPKGVMIPQQALNNHMHWMLDTFPFTAQDRFLQKTPSSFDASIWEFLAPWLLGATLIVARPGLQQDSAALVDLLAREQISVLQVVPTLLHMLLQEPGFVDCQHLRHLFCGGEQLSTDLSRHLSEQLPAVHLHNLYGPTEVTIDALWDSLDEPVASSSVPIGHPIANTQAYVLDAFLQVLPPGLPGELYLAGAGLARGYLGQPERTAERFLPDPFSQHAGARMYQTGDRVRVRPDGRFEYLGRLDQQVKLRGLRIELGEIEARLQEVAGVQQAIVRLHEVLPGEPRLIAYLLAQPSQSPPGDEEVRHHLLQGLPSYMLPTAFVWLDAFPLLPNGKVNRQGFSLPVLEARSESEGPATPTEERLAHIWQEVVQLQQVGRQDNFFALGGHSLLATQVMARVRLLFGVELPLRTLFEYPTLSALALQIEQQRQQQSGSVPGIQRVARQPELPLSFAQSRLWLQDRLGQGRNAYNIPGALRLHGMLDFQALRDSIDLLVQRHESLRTTFHEHSGQLYQRIDGNICVPLPVEDISQLDATSQQQQAQSIIQQVTQMTFDLTLGPLMRLHILRLHEDEHILLIVFHHIIADAWSLSIFTRELATLYEQLAVGQSPHLVPLSIQYVDFAHWQHDMLQGEVLQRLQRYWLHQLRGAPTLLQLPTDYPRPAVQSYRGASVPVHVPVALSQQLSAICQQEQVTPFMVLLVAFQFLLAHYSGQEDILVGTDVAGRRQIETEQLIGFFINQLVLRTRFSGISTFRDALQQVRTTTLEAYDNQDLPFEQVVEITGQKRTLTHTPLFQAKLVLLNTPEATIKLPGLALETVEILEESAKFDITLFLHDTKQGITGSWNYNTDLFTTQTMLKMVRHFELVLQCILTDPDASLSSFSFETVDERKQKKMVQQEFNQTNISRFKSFKPKALALSEQEPVTLGTLPGGGDLPLVIEPALDNVDLVDWTRSNLPLLELELQKHGSILFRGFHIDSPATFEHFAHAITSELFNENGEHPRESVSGNVYTPVFFPKDKKLLWHNENSFNYHGPQKIWFCCAQPADEGGETPIVDSRKVFEMMDPQIKEEFMRKQVMYVRNYGDGAGLSWQDVFRTDDKAVVEERCRQDDMQFEWRTGNRLHTSCVRPAVLAHPQTQQLSWFNQAQHWHISCLDSKTREALLAIFQEEDFPRSCYFGDGSIIPDATMAKICNVYQQLEVCFPWQKGDVIMLDNILTAHARNAYNGTRKILVAMGDMINYTNPSL